MSREVHIGIPGKMVDRFIERVPGFVRNDFLRKATALFFAVLVWVSVSNKLGKEDQIDGVEVKVTLPANYLLVEKPQKVTLRVRAREGLINRLYPSDFTVNASVDSTRLKNLEGNIAFVELKPADVEAPVRVSVLEVQPQKIAVKIDRLVTRSVTVKPQFSGKPPRGFTTGKVVLNPPEVSIAGPEQQIGKIEFVSTRPIALDETTVVGFDYPVEVEKPVQTATISPPEVIAQVEIREEFEQRVFKAIPLKVLEPSGQDNLEVIPLSSPHVEVTIGGPKEAVLALKPEQIKAFVDLSPFDNPGTYTAQVDCWLSGGGTVEVKNIFPPQVQVSIVKIAKDAEPKP